MFAFPRPDLIKILEEALSVVAGIQVAVSPEQRLTRKSGLNPTKAVAVPLLRSAKTRPK